MYASLSEFRDKADWEGGLAQMLFNYGVSLEELPRNTPEEIRFFDLVSFLLSHKDMFNEAENLMWDAED